MYNKHKEEFKRGQIKRKKGDGRSGRRWGGAFAVIRTERYSRCRRMQVAPAVPDEVLLPCWATKLFICLKQGSAEGEGRGNHFAFCSSTGSMLYFSLKDLIKGINFIYYLFHFQPLISLTVGSHRQECQLILFTTRQLFSLCCLSHVKGHRLTSTSPLRSKVNGSGWVRHITGLFVPNTVTSSIIDRQGSVVQTTVHRFCSAKCILLHKCGIRCLLWCTTKMITHRKMFKLIPLIFQEAMFY